jgi:hypothetical protein
MGQQIQVAQFFSQIEFFETIRQNELGIFIWKYELPWDTNGV